MNIESMITIVAGGLFLLVFALLLVQQGRLRRQMERIEAFDYILKERGKELVELKKKLEETPKPPA